MIEKFSVLHLPIHLSRNYGDWLLERLNQQIGSHVVTLNAEMVIASEKNPVLCDIIQKADLTIPDGSGIIFYLNLYHKKQPRFPGIELAEELITRLGKNQGLIYFYGGKPEIIEQAKSHWINQIKDIHLTAYHGYLNDHEQEQLKAELAEKQPQLILVGLGVPRQEIWIRDHRYLCPNAIWIGVGGSFDIWSGVKDRAPAFFRKYHLEWLYRLYQEPWRWKRMLALPQFMIKSLVDRLKHC